METTFVIPDLPVVEAWRESHHPHAANANSAGTPSDDAEPDMMDSSTHSYHTHTSDNTTSTRRIRGRAGLRGLNSTSTGEATTAEGAFVFENNQGGGARTTNTTGGAGSNARGADASCCSALSPPRRVGLAMVAVVVMCVALSFIALLQSSYGYGKVSRVAEALRPTDVGKLLDCMESCTLEFQEWSFYVLADRRNPSLFTVEPSASKLAARISHFGPETMFATSQKCVDAIPGSLLSNTHSTSNGVRDTVIASWFVLQSLRSQLENIARVASSSSIVGGATGNQLQGITMASLRPYVTFLDNLNSNIDDDFGVGREYATGVKQSVTKIDGLLFFEFWSPVDNLLAFQLARHRFLHVVEDFVVLSLAAAERVWAAQSWIDGGKAVNTTFTGMFLNSDVAFNKSTIKGYVAASINSMNNAASTSATAMTGLSSDTTVFTDLREDLEEVCGNYEFLYSAVNWWQSARSDLSRHLDVASEPTTVGSYNDLSNLCASFAVGPLSDLETITSTGLQRRLSNDRVAASSVYSDPIAMSQYASPVEIFEQISFPDWINGVMNAVMSTSAGLPTAAPPVPLSGVTAPAATSTDAVPFASVIKALIYDIRLATTLMNQAALENVDKLQRELAASAVLFGLFLILFPYILYRYIKFRSRLSAAQTELVQRRLAMQEAVQPFVPEQYLLAMDYHDIADVCAGDHREVLLTMVFCMVHNYGQMQALTNREFLFAFQHRFVSACSEITVNYDGFMDKFMGDGVFVLFRKAVDAIGGTAALSQLAPTLTSTFRSRRSASSRGGKSNKSLTRADSVVERAGSASTHTLGGGRKRSPVGGRTRSMSSSDHGGGGGGGPQDGSRRSVLPNDVPTAVSLSEDTKSLTSTHNGVNTNTQPPTTYEDTGAQGTPAAAAIMFVPMRNSRGSRNNYSSDVRSNGRDDGSNSGALPSMPFVEKEHKGSANALLAPQQTTDSRLRRRSASMGALMSAADSVDRSATHESRASSTSASVAVRPILGMGIHTGQVCVGILGDDYRRSCTLISSKVNLASRLALVTKRLKVDALVTRETTVEANRSDTVDDLAASRTALGADRVHVGTVLDEIRDLGPIKVLGQNQAVNVLEIFSANEPDVKAYKLATKEMWEEASRLREKEDFRAAAGILREIKSMQQSLVSTISAAALPTLGSTPGPGGAVATVPYVDVPLEFKLRESTRNMMEFNEK